MQSISLTASKQYAVRDKQSSKESKYMELFLQQLRDETPYQHFINVLENFSKKEDVHLSSLFYCRFESQEKVTFGVSAWNMQEKVPYSEFVAGIEKVCRDRSGEDLQQDPSQKSKIDELLEELKLNFGVATG